MAHKRFMPVNHGWQKFHLDNAGIVVQMGKGRCQGKSHAKASNNHLCPGSVGNRVAGQCPQGLFRCASAAVHQLLTIHPDGKFLVPLEQNNFISAIRGGGDIQLFPGNHEAPLDFNSSNATDSM